MTRVKMRYLFACLAVPMLVWALLTSPVPVLAETGWLQQLLSAPLPDDGNVFNYLITPDGKYVVYTADRFEDNHLNLFRVPSKGGSSVQLDLFPTQKLAVTTASTQAGLSPSIICCDPPPPQRGTKLKEISPDSKWVLFELSLTNYSVPVEGGTPIELVGPIGQGGNLGRVYISPDSQYVVIAGNTSLGSPEGLNSVPIGGGPVNSLGVLPSKSDYYSRVEIAPDSQHVIYWAGTTSVELYSVPITGGTPLKLNAPLVSGGTVDSAGNANISSDGRTVVYKADQDTDEVWELYSVSIDGGPITKLNAPLVNDGDVYSFQISPDGERVVYVADQESDEEWKIYSVAISGGVPVELPLLSTENVEAHWNFLITPNGRRVIYAAASTETGLPVALYSIAIEGGTPVALSGPPPTAGSIEGLQLSPDGEDVEYYIYTTDNNQSIHYELFVAAVSDGTRVNIDLSAVDDYLYSGPRFTDDSAHLLFLSYTPPEGIGLFRVSANGGKVERLDSPQHRLSLTQFDFAQVPGSSTVVYGVSDAETGQIELMRSFEANFTNKVVLPSIMNK